MSGTIYRETCIRHHRPNVISQAVFCLPTACSPRFRHGTVPWWNRGLQAVGSRHSCQPEIAFQSSPQSHHHPWLIILDIGYSVIVTFSIPCGVQSHFLSCQCRGASQQTKGLPLNVYTKISTVQLPSRITPTSIKMVAPVIKPTYCSYHYTWRTGKNMGVRPCFAFFFFFFTEFQLPVLRAAQ